MLLVCGPHGFREAVDRICSIAGEEEKGLKSLVLFQLVGEADISKGKGKD